MFDTSRSIGGGVPCLSRTAAKPHYLIIVFVCALFPLVALYLYGYIGTPTCHLTYANQLHSSNTSHAVDPLPSDSPARTSRLHYLIPSTLVKPPVCANVASALLNRYAIPTIVGYKGKGEFDAKAAHIAKLRAIRRYLLSDAGKDEDDLVVVADGFDVLAMLPAEAMIERYFEVTAQADQRLADMSGLTVAEAHERGLRQTLLWGTDKGCFPLRMDEPQCWLVPFSPLPRYVWGPKSDLTGELPWSDSRYLNSGTVIGPVGDLRRMIDGVLALINATWDENEQYRNSDQYYVSQLYARQEYHRILYRLNGEEFPDDVRDGRKLPEKKTEDDDETEYHVMVDFDSTFTQTQCHNERFIQRIAFDSHHNTAYIDDDYMEEGDSFKPYDIQMPSNVYQGLKRLHDSLPEEEKPHDSARSWIQSLRMGTNIGTQKIYAFYHNTCTKRWFIDRHQDTWYFPFIRPLLRAAANANRDREPIHPRPIDGRIWLPYQQYPKDKKLFDEYGGVFTDYEPESFIPFQQVCAENITDVIGDGS